MSYILFNLSQHYIYLPPINHTLSVGDDIWLKLKMQFIRIFYFKLRIQFYIIKEIHGGLDNCKSQVVGTDTKDTFKGFRIMHVF